MKGRGPEVACQEQIECGIDWQFWTFKDGRRHYKWSSTGDKGDERNKSDRVVEQELMKWMMVCSGRIVNIWKVKHFKEKIFIEEAKFDRGPMIYVEWVNVLTERCGNQIID